MRLKNQKIQTSATDLAKHLACRHLTTLDFLAATGKLERVYRNDPGIEVLEERGRRHKYRKNKRDLDGIPAGVSHTNYYVRACGRDGFGGYDKKLFRDH